VGSSATNELGEVVDPVRFGETWQDELPVLFKAAKELAEVVRTDARLAAEVRRDDQPCKIFGVGAIERPLGAEVGVHRSPGDVGPGQDVLQAYRAVGPGRELLARRTQDLRTRRVHTDFSLSCVANPIPSTGAINGRSWQSAGLNSGFGFATTLSVAYRRQKQRKSM
jgi:hypothetical protein